MKPHVLTLFSLCVSLAPFFLENALALTPLCQSRSMYCTYDITPHWRLVSLRGGWYRVFFLCFSVPGGGDWLWSVLLPCTCLLEDLWNSYSYLYLQFPVRTISTYKCSMSQYKGIKAYLTVSYAEDDVGMEHLWCLGIGIPGVSVDEYENPRIETSRAVWACGWMLRWCRVQCWYGVVSLITCPGSITSTRTCSSTSLPDISPRISAHNLHQQTT